MKVFSGIGELEQAVGTHLGHSQRHLIQQRRTDAFAEATGDRPWIHVDARKAADGP